MPTGWPFSIHRALPLFLLSTVWLMLWNQQRVEWSINAQYAYGWSIPVLFVALCWLRWQRAPKAEPPSGRLAGAIGALLLVLALAPVLPLRFLQEANPEWRLLAWIQAAQAVGITALALWWWGGFPWLRTFTFPLLFTFAAVPWPVPLETLFIQRLMRMVAAATTELLHLVSIPAIQLGNTIELAAGVVGVNEACSGIRSVQTCVVLSILLGELGHMTWGRRALLFLGAVCFAPVANIGRTFFLSLQASKSGIQAVTELHDTAAAVEFGLCFAAVIGLAWWLNRGAHPEALEEAAPPSDLASLRRVPWGVIVATAVCLLGSEIFVEAWYRSGQTVAQTGVTQGWIAQWPKAAEAYKERIIDDHIKASLRFDRGRSASWQEPDGSMWTGSYIEWEPGRTSIQSAHSHNPGVCLPAIGYSFVADRGVKQYEVNSRTLHLRHVELATGDGRQVHAFHAVMENSPVDLLDGSGGSLTHRSRITAALLGRRNPGQVMFELVGTSAGQTDIADSVNRVLSRIIIDRE